MFTLKPFFRIVAVATIVTAVIEIVVHHQVHFSFVDFSHFYRFVLIVIDEP